MSSFSIIDSFLDVLITLIFLLNDCVRSTTANNSLSRIFSSYKLKSSVGRAEKLL